MIHLCRKIVEYYILFLCYTYYIVEYNTLLLCIYLEELLTNGLDNSFLMGKSKTESGCPQYKLLSIIVSTSKYLRASDNISTYLPCSDLKAMPQLSVNMHGLNHFPEEWKTDTAQCDKI